MDRQTLLSPIKVKPKYIAQRCPVCNGFGTLKYGSKTCQGCEGKGWVLVPLEDTSSYSNSGQSLLT